MESTPKPPVPRASAAVPSSQAPEGIASAISPDARQAQREALLGALKELSDLQHLVEVAPREALRVAGERSLGPGCTRASLCAFMFHAAPIARRMHLGPLSDDVKLNRWCVRDIKAWYGWLDSHDPLAARMVDLRYYGGLSFKEQSIVLAHPVRAIIRDVRFAKRWLSIELKERISPTVESSPTR